MMSFRGGRIRWKLNRALTEALRNTSRQEKTSLFTIFAAALDTLLYRYTGSEDILVGLPLADRDRQEVQSLIGFLLHTHVLRTKLWTGPFANCSGACKKESWTSMPIAPFPSIISFGNFVRNETAVTLHCFK